jgi:MFS family permease
MTSVESAIFLSSYDLANILASPFIGYFGDKSVLKHKIIALSMFGLSIGSTVMILPEIFSDKTIPLITQFFKNQTNNDNNNNKIPTDQQVCSLIHNNTSSNFNFPNENGIIDDSFLSKLSGNHIKYMFIIANMINGVSSVSLYTVVVSYLEGMFNRDQINLRQGIYYATGAIGVGCGMVITGNFLNINGRRHIQNSSQMNSNSVNWIGVSFD